MIIQHQQVKRRSPLADQGQADVMKVARSIEGQRRLGVRLRGAHSRQPLLETTKCAKTATEAEAECRFLQKEHAGATESDHRFLSHDAAVEVENVNSHCCAVR